MASSDQTHRSRTGGTDVTPKGGRFYTSQRNTVSRKFIQSLREDGVSRGTIRAIERDNAERTDNA
jgi:hypothetical protein